MIHQQTHHQFFMKQLNVENWRVEYVCEWIKGVVEEASYSEYYSKQFELNQIDGKKLSIIELSDLRDYLVSSNLKQHLLVHKSIQCLLQIKQDLNKETLHNLIFNVHNKIIAVLNQIERVETCTCRFLSCECDKCIKIKKYDVVSCSSQLALAYRKLISWLVRIPFTRLKPFETFREEINNEMRCFLKLIRKNSNEKLKEICYRLNTMLNYCKKMLSYCDKNFDDENGKIGCAFSNSYLEKVKIKRSNPEQILGLTLTSLQYGIYTIAEIVRDSSADECSQLNVEDDIIFIDSQIVVGWSSENIIKLLEESFSLNGAISLVLRKMPKDHLNSIKQQKNLALIYKNHTNRINTIKKQQQQQQQNKSNNGHQRKLSFSDMFVSEEFLLNDTSDEEEENYDDNKLSSSNEQLNKDLKTNVNSDTETNAIKANDKLYEKNKNNSKKDNETSKKSKNKLEKKYSRNRLIQSMQNLFFYDKSRSVSVERLETTNSNDNNNGKNLERKKSFDETSPKQTPDSNTKSDVFKSIFSNKRWEPNKKNSFEYDTAPDTPNLLNVKRIDTFKRNNSGEMANYSPKTVSSKPPIDKRSYKLQSKPAMSGWLYKQKHSSSSSSSSSSTSTNSSNSTNAGSSNSQNTLIKNQLNRPIKWKKYWCVLVKDYITFYKQAEDKTPKDFLLLKDFEIKEGSKKYGFIIVDNMKQTSHEFYADQVDYNEWYQALVDLRNRLVGEPITSLSNTSLSSSSGYDTLNLNSSLTRDDLTSVSSHSLPASSTCNRKNNLQLQLSTIIDTIDDSNSSTLNSNNLITSNEKHSQSQQHSSPTLMQQQHQQQSYSSSRESSPDISNSNSKLHSRDSSPGLSYPYVPEPEPCTSESDAEIVYSKNISDRPEIFKNSKKNSSLIANAVTSNAIAGINSSRQKSSSPSPSSASSMTKFVYDQNDPNFQLHHQNEFNTTSLAHVKSNKSASLPGSLQFCVGSFLNNKSKLADINENTNLEIKQQQQQQQQLMQQQQAPVTQPQLPSFFYRQTSLEATPKPHLPLSQSSPKWQPVSTQPSAYHSNSPTSFLYSSYEPTSSPVLSKQPILTSHSMAPMSLNSSLANSSLPTSASFSNSKPLVFNPTSIQMNRQKPTYGFTVGGGGITSGNSVGSPGYYYQPTQPSFYLPTSTPLNSISKLSFQVRPFDQAVKPKPEMSTLPRGSITQLNKFNYLPNQLDVQYQQQQQQQQPLPTSLLYTHQASKPSPSAIRSAQSLSQQQPPGSPMVYRTEITIMPSSTVNPSPTPASSLNSLGYNSPHNLPKRPMN